jgi:hypothetical protein
MRTKSLVLFRSKSTGFEEGKMEKAPVPDPRTVWEPCTVTEEQIQALADRGLLRPKTKVGWRPAAGEEFSTEGDRRDRRLPHAFERGFGVPTGDFLRGLLFFYLIELIHLVPNSITIFSTFIHLCEAYLGIAPHFHLWCHFFELKKTGKAGAIGSVGFMLRWNMKSKYVDLALLDNTTGWKQGWFYLDNPVSALKTRTGRAPVPYPDWTNQLPLRDTEELQPLLDDLEQLKAEGLTGGAVVISFCRRLIQPIQDRAHPTFEYWGQSDPTRVVKRKVSKAEMMAWAKNIFGGWIRNRDFPKALGMYHPSDTVCLRLRFLSKIGLQISLLLGLDLIDLSCLDFSASRGIYWCLAHLRNEDQRSYKVCDATDVQEEPPPPVDEYLSDSMVARDDEPPTMSRRAPSKVAAARCTR